MKPIFFLFPLLVAGFGLSDANADWLNFRGPNASGYAGAAADATALPSTLGESCITWSAELPGRGISSPVIVGERLFLTCSSGPADNQNRLHVRCHSTVDGSLIWERKFRATGRTMTHKKTCVAAPTMASDGERVFALYSSNDLFALDLDGNLLWTRGLTVDYPNASNSLGMASSPVVAGGALICQIENDSESFAIGLDPATGINLWKTDRPKAANWTSPTVMEIDGQQIVALQSSRGISGVIPKTGSEVWNYADGASTTPSSAAAGDTLFIPSHGLTAIRPGSEGGEVEPLWRAETQRPGTGSPVIIEGTAYTINGAGVITAADTSSGEAEWRLRLKGPFSGSPVAIDHFLFIFSEAGVGQCIDLSGEEGKVVGTIELNDTILSTAAIDAATNSIYVRSDKRLWKLGP